MSRAVKVRRLITVEYEALVEGYTAPDGRQMTDAEIEAEEQASDDADTILTNIVGEVVTVKFVGGAS